MVSGSPIAACLERAAVQTWANRSTSDPNAQLPADASQPSAAVSCQENVVKAAALPRHPAQNVLTILTRAQIVSWMNRTAGFEGERHIQCATQVASKVSCTEGDEVGSPSADHARSEGALVGCRKTTRKGLVRGRARSALEKVRGKEWE